MIKFRKEVLNTDKQDIWEKVKYSIFINAVLHNPSIYSAYYTNIRQKDVVKGLCKKGNYYFQVNYHEIEMGKSTWYRLIVADNSDDNKRMAVLFAKNIEGKLIEMDCSGMREDVIIDLNFGGRRWEGGELNGKPFGFGCEYSEDGNLVYEGFVFEGKKVCFGKEWNDDGNNNCLVYEGGYCNGERWGKGKSYDLSGNVDFEGEWMNNHGMSEEEKIDLMNELIVPLSIEEFVIGNKMFNDESITILHFSPLLVRLKRIRFGNRCFKHVRKFVIDGLESLESVRIGRECFNGCGEDNDRICRITNCPTLQRIVICNGSCINNYLTLSNVTSLQSIKFGEKCFKYDSLVLKGM